MTNVIENLSLRSKYMSLKAETVRGDRFVHNLQNNEFFV